MSVDDREAGRIAAEAAADLAGSLLQYVAANDPWVEGEVVPADALDRLAAAQRETVTTLARFARDRHVPPAAPAFASVFTEYHYVTFAWLFPRLTGDQGERIARLHTRRDELAGREGSAATRAALAAAIEREEATLAGLARLDLSPESSSPGPSRS